MFVSCGRRSSFGYPPTAETPSEVDFCTWCWLVLLNPSLSRELPDEWLLVDWGLLVADTPLAELKDDGPFPTGALTVFEVEFFPFTLFPAAVPVKYRNPQFRFYTYYLQSMWNEPADGCWFELLGVDEESLVLLELLCDILRRCPRPRPPIFW